jgi:outer membrane protein assembly factor BamA
MHGEDDDAVIPGWRYEFQREYELFRDYGTDWRLGSSFALNSEDGLILAAGPILYQFGFRTFPYVYRMELLGGVSIPTGRFKISYSGFWPRISERLSVTLNAYASQLELINFYGFGNESARDGAKEDDGYYRVSSTELYVQPSLQYRIKHWFIAGVGVAVKNFKVREVEEDRLINPSVLEQYGDNRTLGSAGLSLLVDTRDHPMAPHGGLSLGLQAWNYLEVFGNQSPFQKYIGEVRVYLGDTLVTDVMLAVRVKGELIDGEFPFHEAAFLGGAGSLRGFASQRFGGDASLMGSAELRFSIGRWKLLVPTEVGVFVLADAGRVWVDNESPGEYHTDAGGGIWLAPLNRDMILSIAVASSVEGVFVVGGIGFGF